MRLAQIGIVIIVIGVVASGCSLFEAKPHITLFGENRTYVHWLASSQDECDQLNDQGINCFQMLEFFPNGEVEVMLTDIVHRGNYVIENRSRIVITLQPNPETPSKLLYTVIDDGQRLVDDLTDSFWELE